MKRFERFSVRLPHRVCRSVLIGAAAVTLASGTNIISPAPLATASAAEPPVLTDESPMPDFGVASATGRVQTWNDKERLMRADMPWLNSAPLRRASLRGKVVLVDFWTYSCINSLRNLAYIRSWAAKYKRAGLVVIGVHTPEFAFEKVRSNVEGSVRRLNVAYPVPIDSDYMIWQSFNNEYWPADYFIDGQGRIRYHHFGEGDYAASERVIQELLKNNGARDVSVELTRISGTGVEAPPSDAIESPETYIGYRHSERFSSPETVARDAVKRYTAPARPRLNRWGLTGSWQVGGESAVTTARGGIVFRFHARDLHLVLGPAKDEKPVHFRVTLDGAAPGSDAGVDTAADGAGEVRRPRLYQLIRQKDRTKDRTFEIQFLDPGVHAYAFTFG